MTDRPKPSAPWRRNALAWLALLGLLAVSLGAAYAPLGRYGTPAGIAIAFIKAALVLVVFMQLGRTGSLPRLAATAGGLFALVLFVLTFTDVLSRW